MKNDINSVLLQMLEIYKMPGQAFWRSLEFLKLMELKNEWGFARPVLEIGCGNGAFSSLIFDKIDDAIDINPRAIERARQSTNLYEHLHCVDARKMEFPDSTYRTVFANCVIEHIPNIEQIVKSLYRVLAPSGFLLTTVPLVEMNNFLLFPSNSYAKLRQNQLAHLNLFTIDEWRQLFLSEGFSQFQFFPYLYGEQCRLWDRVDFPGCVGYGRYTISSAFSILTSPLPDNLVLAGRKWVAQFLSRYMAYKQDDVPCAIAIIAIK